jgi:hypothetical protein
MWNSFHFAIGFVISYAAASLSEAFLHRTVGHATTRVRRIWARYPRFCGFLTRAHYRHAVVHHGLTFAQDHVTQFSDDDDKARVDAIVASRCDHRIKEERYGLSVGLRSLLTFNAPALPMLPVLYWLCGPYACLGAAPPLLSMPLLSMLIHPYLHLSHSDALRLSPRPTAFLLKTRYFRIVARYHYMHHLYPRFNFNLLLGGDWLLGTVRRATSDDRHAMKEVGIHIH